MNIWTLGSNLHRFSGQEAVKKGPKTSKHFEIIFFGGGFLEVFGARNRRDSIGLGWNFVELKLKSSPIDFWGSRGLIRGLIEKNQRYESKKKVEKVLGGALAPPIV